MNDPRVPSDTLVDAYFEAEEYANAVPELRDYHALRREILETLFECSLEDVPRARGASPVDEHDANALRSLARSCLKRSKAVYGPFSIYLEGAPGPREATLRERHRARLNEAVDALKARIRAIFCDALRECFPVAPSRTFPLEVLHQRGLPETRPDPDDFW